MGEAHGIVLSLVGCKEIEPIPRIHCRTCHTCRTSPTCSLQVARLRALHVLYFAPFKARIAKNDFRLLLGGESAIIRPVSRKAILGTCFDMCMLDEIRAKREEIYAIARAHKAEKLWVFG